MEELTRVQHPTATREVLIEKLVGPWRIFPACTGLESGDLVFEGHILVKRPGGCFDLVWP